jgi:hypothetical protein
MADTSQAKNTRKMFGAKRASQKVAFSKSRKVAAGVRNYATASKWAGGAVAATGALMTGASGGIGGVLGGGAMILGGATWAVGARALEKHANNRIGTLKRGASKKRAAISRMKKKAEIKAISKRKAAAAKSKKTGGPRGFANKKNQAAALAARRRKSK